MCTTIKVIKLKLLKSIIGIRILVSEIIQDKLFGIERFNYPQRYKFIHDKNTEIVNLKNTEIVKWYN